MEGRYVRKTVSRNIAVVGLALLAISFLFFSGTGYSQTKMKEVKIGAVYPMTGPTGSFGQVIMRGWDIAVEEINAEGGIKSLGGASLKTVLADTEGTPRVGMTQVEKIAMNKEIPIIAGCWASAVTYPVTQVSEQYRLPHLVGIATQVDIMRRGFKYVFRYALPTDGSGRNVVDFVEYQAKKAGRTVNRAALMTVDDNFGRDTAKWIKKALERTNQKIVAEIYHPLKATTLDVEVAQVKAANPDVIYGTAFLYDGALLTKTLRTQGVKPQGIVLLGGNSNPEYLKLVGNQAEHFFGQFKFDTDLNKPDLAEFDAKLVKRHGHHGDPFSATGYGLVYLIRDVLERAGTIDREKVRDALASTNITSGKALALPGAFVRFDQNGENLGAREHISQVLNGSWHSVWPMDMPRKYEAVWPMPK